MEAILFTNARERGLPQSSVALPDLAHASGLRERTNLRTTGSGCGSDLILFQRARSARRDAPRAIRRKRSVATQVGSAPDESVDSALDPSPGVAPGWQSIQMDLQTSGATFNFALRQYAAH